MKYARYMVLVFALGSMTSGFEAATRRRVIIASALTGAAAGLPAACRMYKKRRHMSDWQRSSGSSSMHRELAKAFAQVAVVGGASYFFGSYFTPGVKLKTAEGLLIKLRERELCMYLLDCSELDGHVDYDVLFCDLEKMYWGAIFLPIAYREVVAIERLLAAIDAILDGLLADRAVTEKQRAIAQQYRGEVLDVVRRRAKVLRNFVLPHPLFKAQVATYNELCSMGRFKDSVLDADTLQAGLTVRDYEFVWRHVALQKQRAEQIVKAQATTRKVATSIHS